MVRVYCEKTQIPPQSRQIRSTGLVRLEPSGTFARVEPREADQAIVELIGPAEAGDTRSAEQMFAVLYRELHRLAERQLRRHGAALSLGTTTLLHEAYLHLAGHEGAHFPDRARFLGYAAKAMRWIVIDYARRSRAQRRGGGETEIQLTDAVAETRTHRCDRA